MQTSSDLSETECEGRSLFSKLLQLLLFSFRGTFLGLFNDRTVVCVYVCVCVVCVCLHAWERQEGTRPDCNQSSLFMTSWRSRVCVLVCVCMCFSVCVFQCVCVYVLYTPNVVTVKSHASSTGDKQHSARRLNKRIKSNQTSFVLSFKIRLHVISI